MQRSIRWSYFLGLAPCLLMMLMDWVICQMCSLTVLPIRCVVKPPLSCQSLMVSAALWLTPTPAFMAQTRTRTVGICIVLASVTTDFCNQKASHCILGCQWWSVIDWWISNDYYSKRASGLLNISSRVKQCGSRGQESVSNVLEIVSEVGRQGEYISGLGGYLWSSDIVLAAIQLGIILLNII